jgi:hypothetical protein
VNWMYEPSQVVNINYSVILTGVVQGVENTSGFLLDSLQTLLQYQEDLDGCLQDMEELESQLSSMTTSTDST